MTETLQAHKPRGRKARNITSGKGFTRRQAGGPAAHKEAVRLANTERRIAARQRKAWRLFLAGATFEQVGQQTGTSGKTAWYDCVAYRSLLRERDAYGAELMLARQNGQLDALVLSHWGRMGQRDSAQVILSALDRQAKLNGLDRKGHDAFTPEQVISLVRTISSLFLEVVQDNELRRQFAAGLRRRLGPKIDAPIDVTPAGGVADHAAG